MNNDHLNKFKTETGSNVKIEKKEHFIWENKPKICEIQLDVNIVGFTMAPLPAMSHGTVRCMYIIYTTIVKTTTNSALHFIHFKNLWHEEEKKSGEFF